MQSILKGREFFSELPLAEFNARRSAIYAIDFNWKYLFMNTAAIDRLRGKSFVGKYVEEIWENYPDLNLRSLYHMLKEPVAGRTPCSMSICSPFDNLPVNIIGQPLADCYFFSVNEPMDKIALREELRGAMRRKHD